MIGGNEKKKQPIFRSWRISEGYRGDRCKLQSEAHEIFRKAGAMTAGVAVGAGFLSQVIDKLGGHNIEEVVRQHAGGMVSAAAMPDLPVQAAAEAGSDNASKLLEDHVLTSADGKQGLWGVIESRLPEDMPQAEKAKAAAALEKMIAQKLETMSPEEQKRRVSDDDRFAGRRSGSAAYCLRKK
jgi:ribosomal protein L12E/L44/L45/RPP1/RPP2